MISERDLCNVAPAFRGLSAAAREQVIRAAIYRRYRAKQTLYHAGDAADGLYVVLSGKVLVVRETATHAEMLHTESAGGVLGEIPVFGGGAFPATATAVEKTHCVHLPRAVVDRLIDEEPSFARFAIRRLAARAQSLLKRIDELTATTILSRLAAYVLERSRAEETSFTLGMSQAALAAELGTAREVVVRAIATLVEAGAIVRTGRSRFALKDRTRLSRMASHR